MSKKLLLASLAALLSGAVFAAVCAAIWPVHAPEWSVRITSAVYLAGIIVLVAGVLAWLRSDGKPGR